MNLKRIMVIFLFTVLIAVTTFIAFAEEAAPVAESPVVSAVDPVVPITAPQAPSQTENDTQWVWGEVASLDGTSKSVSLKYLDYETDQEKDIVLVVDEKTTFENVKSFDELKVKDTLSIDYLVSPEGKNLAKNVGLEKPDAPVIVPAQVVEELKPADIQAQDAVAVPAVNPEPVVETSTATSVVSEAVTQ